MANRRINDGRAIHQIIGAPHDVSRWACVHITPQYSWARSERPASAPYVCERKNSAPLRMVQLDVLKADWNRIYSSEGMTSKRLCDHEQVVP